MLKMAMNSSGEYSLPLSQSLLRKSISRPLYEKKKKSHPLLIRSNVKHDEALDNKIFFLFPETWK